MSLNIPGLKAVLIFVIGSALAFLAVKLCARVTGDSSDSARTFLRAVISIAVFVIIYYGASFVTGWDVYDSSLETIKYLAAVIGAGCYWIGSQINS